MKQTFIAKVKNSDIGWVRSALGHLYEFDTVYQRERMVQHFFDLRDTDCKTVIGKTSRPKSQEALGMYFGAVVPATAMDSKELTYDVNQIYDDWMEYKRQGKVTDTLFEATDQMLRLEFHYGWTGTLEGGRQKYAKTLEDRDNEELLVLIEKVMEWRNEQGYPFIDVERYKKERDDAPTKSVQ